MKYDIASALQELKPGAEWVLRGNNYSDLEWLDSGQTKPTETEVTNKNLTFSSGITKYMGLGKIDQYLEQGNEDERTFCSIKF